MVMLKSNNKFNPSHEPVELKGYWVSRRNCVGLKAGYVYPYGTLNGYDVILNSDNNLWQVCPDEGVYWNNNDVYCRADSTYKCGIEKGDVFPVAYNIAGRRFNNGCVWCFNSKLEYVALSKKSLTEIKPTWTAQAMTARWQQSQEKLEQARERRPGTVISFISGMFGSGGGSVVGKEVCGKGGAMTLDFVPLADNKYVTVEFTKGGKPYTYILPAGMNAEPGDEAVVRVDNPNYPELKGTKIVKVLSVQNANNSGWAYCKAVEYIVDNSAERKKEAEKARAARRQKAEQKVDALRKLVAEQNAAAYNTGKALLQAVKDLENENY